MVRKSVKITVCTMAAVMAFSGMNITANAAASSSVLPSGGIELTLAKGNKLESLSIAGPAGGLIHGQNAVWRLHSRVPFLLLG